MTTGAKVAIGCGVALLAVGAAIVAGVVGLGFWAKGKVDRFTGEQQRIDALQKKADLNPFTPPADGLIREDRLLTFLAARRQVYAVYERHAADLEAMSKKKQGDLSDVTKGLGIMNDLRLAQAQALADNAMSQAEYRYLVEQVYKTMWAAEVAKETGGKSVSEAAGEGYDAAARQMKEAAESTKTRGAPDETARKGLDDMGKRAEDLERQGAEAREAAKPLDVAPENIALFRKHEADIRKYAMSGLEWIGL